MNETDFLEKVHIFSLMKKRDLRRIAKLTRHHLFHKGDIIITEGDLDNRLFIVVSGEVELIKNLSSKNEMHLGTFVPLCYFGEMALFDDFARSASVIAKVDTEVISLDQWNLRQEIEKYPAMAVELLQMLSRRILTIEKCMLNTPGGLLFICANCKRILNDNNSWIPIEEYITDHFETEFSHGICPDCAKRLYPEFYRAD